ncbi:hypothetical protein DFH09DRAFT_606812 [Mycena vulgaris]|nr:hypothetical protein DFH09DRAFT_606812 [Mycena vulgaris]
MELSVDPPHTDTTYGEGHHSGASHNFAVGALSHKFASSASSSSFGSGVGSDSEYSTGYTSGRPHTVSSLRSVYTPSATHSTMAMGSSTAESLSHNMETEQEAHAHPMDGNRGGSGDGNGTDQTASNLGLCGVLSRPLTPHEAERLAYLDRLKFFLATAPSRWDGDDYAPADAITPTAHPALNRFLLPSQEYVSCVLWNGLYHITGRDIVRALVFRFEAFARPVHNMKKFEEGVFSDLRNLKPGVDASLEEPKSPFLDLLFKYQCIQTQKKQKVFYWFSVPHDRLFFDALERDLKREKMGLESTTHITGEPALSFVYDDAKSLYEQFLVGRVDETSPPGAHKPFVNASASNRDDKAPTPFSAMFSLFEGSPTYKQRRKSGKPSGLGLGLGDGEEEWRGRYIAGAHGAADDGMMADAVTGLGAAEIFIQQARGDLGGGGRQYAVAPQGRHALQPLQQHQYMPAALQAQVLRRPRSHEETVHEAYAANQQLTAQQEAHIAVALAPGSGVTGAAPGQSKTKAFICPLYSCGRLFKGMEHLRRHLRTHTIERPFACPRCDKRFSTSDNLDQHVRTHVRVDGFAGEGDAGAGGSVAGTTTGEDEVGGEGKEVDELPGDENREIEVGPGMHRGPAGVGLGMGMGAMGADTARLGFMPLDVQWCQVELSGDVREVVGDEEGLMMRTAGALPSANARPLAGGNRPFDSGLTEYVNLNGDVQWAFDDSISAPNESASGSRVSGSHRMSMNLDQCDNPDASLLGSCATDLPAPRQYGYTDDDQLSHENLQQRRSGTFVIYSPDNEKPDANAGSLDSTILTSDLGIGGCSISVHEPVEAVTWIENNWEHPLVTSVQENGCGGPFALMLFPTKPALALFGPYDDPFITNAAQSLATLSGFPVVICPCSDNPMNTFDPIRGEASEYNRSRPRDAEGNGDAMEVDMDSNEGVPGGLGGNEQRNTVDNPDGPGSDDDDLYPEGNGGQQPNPENNEGTDSGERGTNYVGTGGDGDDGGGGPGVTDARWESQLHRMHLKLRLKLSSHTYTITIGYKFKFQINGETDLPIDFDNLPRSLSQPEVIALVDFKIETRPRETQVDRSYANIGFVAHRKESIIEREFLHRGFDLPDKLYKHGRQEQIQKGIKASLGFSSGSPMAMAGFSYNRNHDFMLEATDNKIMPRCRVDYETGDEWDEDSKSYTSYNIAYQPQAIQFAPESVDFHPLEIKVGMGINLRPSGLEKPLPKISFINRNQVLIWVSDPTSKARVRGIVVVMKLS